MDLLKLHEKQIKERRYFPTLNEYISNSYERNFVKL